MTEMMQKVFTPSQSIISESLDEMLEATNDPQSAE
jgi:hypothetical protein